MAQLQSSFYMIQTILAIAIDSYFMHNILPTVSGVTARNNAYNNNIIENSA